MNNEDIKTRQENYENLSKLFSEKPDAVDFVPVGPGEFLKCSNHIGIWFKYTGNDEIKEFASNLILIVLQDNIEMILDLVAEEAKIRASTLASDIVLESLRTLLKSDIITEKEFDDLELRIMTGVK